MNHPHTTLIPGGELGAVFNNRLALVGCSLISAISNFWVWKILCKKHDVQQKEFLQELSLLIVKSQLSLQFGENI
jgi:hypothetical protein